MLTNVGRTIDAVEQLRQATDMLALYVYTPLSLASTLVIAGQAEQAKPFFDAAIQVAPGSGFANRISVSRATATGDLQALLDPRLSMPKELNMAVVAGYRAVEAGTAGAKAQAVQTLLALPEDQQYSAVVWLLGDLGATHDAFRIAKRLVVGGSAGPSIFWHPSMRGALDDPDFPALAAEVGLMKYWKASGTRPDACSDKSPPAFCQMI
jgi:hypothetical protein